MDPRAALPTDHQLLDGEGRLHYERLLPEQASVSLTNALYAIHRAIGSHRVCDRSDSSPRTSPPPTPHP